MSKTANVSMTAAQSAFVSRLIESGRYASVSEVMRAGTRLLEQQEAQQAALRAAITQGRASIKSGRTSRTTADEVLAEARRKK